MASPAPLDRLAAVNIMLGVIGQMPVTTLGGTQTVDIELAESVLDETSRAVQSEGWEFNRETNVTLTPTAVTKQVSLNGTILRIDTPRMNTTQRGSRLYNKDTNSFLFDGDVVANILRALDYDDVPPAGRHYIAIRAARVFQKRAQGAQSLDQFTAEDEFVALVALREAEAENEEFSIFDTPGLSRIGVSSFLTNMY